MFKKTPFSLQIFASFMVITIFISFFIYQSSVQNFTEMYKKQISEELTIRASLFADIITSAHLDAEAIDRKAKELRYDIGIRITVITLDGTVIADGEKNPQNMVNHSDRPEFIDALAKGTGGSTRFSETTKVNYQYIAIKRGNYIVRGAFSLKKFDKAIRDYKIKIIKLVFLSLFISLLLSILLTRIISHPIEELKIRAANIGKPEFSPYMVKYGSSEINELSNIITKTSKDILKKIDSISDQKERLRVVLSRMIEGVIAVDNSDKIFLINETAKKMFSLENEESEGFLLQEKIRNVPFQQAVAQLQKGDERLSTEITVPVNGDPRILKISGRTLEQKGGALFVLYDVTDIKRLENLRRDFAGNVSHELRTPLTSIKGFVETLLDGAINEPEDAVRFLDIINRHVDRLNHLIEDLLTIARLEKDEETGELDVEETAIQSIIENAVSFCKTKIEETENRVHIVAPDNELTLLISPSLIEQALINLLENAIKYSPEKSTITITITADEQFLNISVEDNGPGIPAHHLPRLFERFYRVDKARSSSMGGTGLGLAIVKHIANIHNGTVNVESELGKGSKFTIILPYKRNNTKG